MKRHVGLIVAVQLFAGMAAADQYPFAGFYALETPGKGTAGCGFDILHQSHSGEFSGYILDRRHWDAHRQARFLRYKHGTCTFDGTTGIDNCRTLKDHINGTDDAKPDRARITVLDDDAVAMLTLGEGDDADRLANVPPFVFRRCPFGEHEIAARLLNGVESYSTAELREMARSRDAELPIQVLKSITKGAPAAE